MQAVNTEDPNSRTPRAPTALPAGSSNASRASASMRASAPSTTPPSEEGEKAAAGRGSGGCEVEKHAEPHDPRPGTGSTAATMFGHTGVKLAHR